MTTATKKAFTAKGKAIARFTMRVEFAPEYRNVNKETGEVISYWTYRSDLENEKAAKEGKSFAHSMDVLGHIYHRDKHKYNEVKMYDNSLPVGQQLLLHSIKGKIVFPKDTTRLEKFHNWLKRVL